MSASITRASFANLTAGYTLTPRVRITLDVFNLFNAHNSDIDYFYGSRLPGEPTDGIDDIHLHPSAPRTGRLNLVLAF